jgi:hypothetical protein
MLYPHAVTKTLFSHVPVHKDPYSEGSTNLHVCLITVALKMMEEEEEEEEEEEKKKNDWLLNISSAGIFYFSRC